MDKKTKKAVGWIVAVIAVAGLAWFWIYWQQRPARLDEFARCLKDRGAIFYGAFWCPHCQNQKTMFGRSSRLLPYVECSTADGKSQLDICKEKRVEGYPTWEFTDGSREAGEVPLKRLSDKTGCELPK